MIQGVLSTVSMIGCEHLSIDHRTSDLGTTRVAVIGAGAMGCVFGARLAEAGYHTTLVDVQKDVVEAIQTSGVTIVRDGAKRQVEVAATLAPGSLGTVDVVIVFVKGFHTEAAAKSMRPLVDDHTTVVTLQNGMGNGETLAASYDPSRLVLGVTAESGTSLGPGAVDNPGRAVTWSAPTRARTSRLPSRSPRCCAPPTSRPARPPKSARICGRTRRGRIDAARAGAARHDLRADGHRPRDAIAGGRHRP